MRKWHQYRYNIYEKDNKTTNNILPIELMNLAKMDKHFERHNFKAHLKEWII